jgi:hypothetical protein
MPLLITHTLQAKQDLVSILYPAQCLSLKKPSARQKDVVRVP